MLKLSEQQIAEYFQRCYTAVDGLWFVKTEERSGFETALAVDVEVWKVLPKIQARWFKVTADLGNGLAALAEALITRHNLEGFEIKVAWPEQSRFELIISHCPWHQLLVKSGRQNLAAPISERICNTEYSAWAVEFGPGIKFQLGSRICGGAACCRLQFSSQTQQNN